MKSREMVEMSLKTIMAVLACLVLIIFMEGMMYSIYMNKINAKEGISIKIAEQSVAYCELQDDGKYDVYIHNFENTVIQEPTCADPGKGINTCTLCQYSEECTYELKAHSYGSGEVTKKATCTAKGSQTYTCKVCQKTKTESIPAAGHKWTGATCQKAGTCSVCGAVGSKAKHDYEIVRETNPNPKYYAREVDKKCRTCGVEKTLYYVDDIEFDVEYIQSVLDDYAKSYGFVNIIHSVKDLTNQQKSNKFLEVFKFDWYKDPIGHFIEQGKLLIDTKYKNIKNSTFPMERRLLHLEVSYGASASVGCGMLNVYIGLTELPAE